MRSPADPSTRETASMKTSGRAEGQNSTRLEDIENACDDWSSTSHRKGNDDDDDEIDDDVIPTKVTLK